MKLRVDVVNYGQVVSIKVDGADIEDVRRLLGGREAVTMAVRRGGSGSPASPAMIAKGVETFLAQGDTARLGAALAEVWRAMEQVRSGGGVLDGD